MGVGRGGVGVGEGVSKVDKVDKSAQNPSAISLASAALWTKRKDKLSPPTLPTSARKVHFSSPATTDATIHIQRCLPKLRGCRQCRCPLQNTWPSAAAAARLRLCCKRMPPVEPAPSAARRAPAARGRRLRPAIRPSTIAIRARLISAVVFSFGFAISYSKRSLRGKLKGNIVDYPFFSYDATIVNVTVGIRRLACRLVARCDEFSHNLLFWSKGNATLSPISN